MEEKSINDFLDQIHLGKWESVMPKIPSNSIDIIITSPPYNVDLGNNKHKKDAYEDYEDNLPYEKYLEWMNDLFYACNRVLKIGGRLCINIGDGANGQIPTHADFTHLIKNVGIWKYKQQDVDIVPFQMITTIVWDKKQIGASCLLGDELILTTRGYKPIRDIKCGDMVFTHKRRFRKVINKFCRKYSGEMVKLNIVNGDSIIVTPEHPIAISKLDRKCGKYCPKKKPSENFKWVKAEDICGENYVVVPKYTTQYHGGNLSRKISSITGVNIDYNKDIFRLLGYYLGDGSVHKKEVRFDFGPNENDYCLDIEEICKKNKWSYYYEKRENLLRICVSSHGALPRILLGMGGDSAKNKSMHGFIFQCPFYLQKEILIGLYRSDGCITNNRFVYTTISDKLAYQIRDLLLRLKIGSNVKKRKVYPSKKYQNRIIVSGNCFDVFVGGKDFERCIKLLGEEKNWDVKYHFSVNKTGCHYLFNKISSKEIVRVKDIEVFNFQTEEDESYVGKCLYHNCSWGSFQNPVQPSFPTQFEFIIVFGKGSTRHEGDPSRITVSKEDFIQNSRALWTFPPETQMMKLYGHPAMFPETLPERLLDQLSYADDIVLDPFSGAGTTCAVAKRMNRHYIGIEMTERYYDKSIERLSGIPCTERIKVEGKEVEIPSWIL